MRATDTMREVVEVFDPIRESMQRDQFAGQAMAAMIVSSAGQVLSSDVIARHAWSMADCMMAERARRALRKGGDA